MQSSTFTVPRNSQHRNKNVFHVRAHKHAYIRSKPIAISFQAIGFRETVTSLWKTERDNFTRLAESQQKLSSQQHRQAYDLFCCLHESLEGFVACVQRCFKQDTRSVARAMISSVAVQSDNLSGVCVFQARTAIWGVAGRGGTCVR